MTKIERFNTARIIFDFTYKGIKMNRVMAEDLFLILNQDWKFGNGQIKGFFQRYEVEMIRFDSARHKILATFGPYPRKDHYELYQQVIGRLDDTVASNSLMNIKRIFCFHLPTLYKVLMHATPCIFKIGGMSFMQKILTLSTCVMYCYTIDYLEKMKFEGVKKYLCQCHVLDLENLLTQFFKNRGIPTYSLEEGLYMILKVNPDDASIGYNNFETDHLLLWGQFSKDEYMTVGIPENRMEVAGYPKLVDLKELKPDNHYKKVMVLLARHSFINTNMSLLKILSKYTDKYEFYIKPHPAAVEYYSKVADEYGMNTIPSNETIDNCLHQDKFDYCVAVNTSAYYESWMRGVPCLRYTDNTFDLMSGFNDVFENSDQFETIIRNLQQMPLAELQRDIDNMLKYSIGLGIDRYKEIVLG